MASHSDLAKRLFQHVDVLAGLIGPRHLAKRTAWDAAVTYIEQQFGKFGYEALRETYSVREQSVSNLIVEIPGSHRPDEIVILGAHYDTVPTTPGADDNASAVAALLEAARLLKSTQPRRTLRFVSFACEEQPYSVTGTMGSQHHARFCRQKRERIVGMICLEMLGFYSTLPHSQQIPPGIPRWLRWVFPRRGDFLAAVGNLPSWRLGWSFRRGFKRASSLPLFSISLPERIQEIRLSDNSSFWDQGYPALMITDTSFLRNPHYHLATDTPDTLDYDRLALATQGIAGGLARLARAVKQ